MANRVKIPNLGEKKSIGVMENGVVRSLTAQVCAVDKCLISVSKIAKAGHRVVSEEDEGNYNEDKHTKERNWLIETRGVYSTKMWIKTEGSPAFIRPGL